MARLVEQRLSDAVGTVIVDNRPGARGTIGSRGAAAAAPDGYALLLGGDGARRTGNRRRPPMCR
jgi:tripartite-type tricarboxylate transporter receptor subunit TctC